IRAYERFFKEKEKSQKESIQNGQKGQKGKRAGGGTGVEGPGALDTVVLEPSNQAHTAYMSLIKLVHALDKDLAGGDTLKAEEITDEKAREVLRDIFGI
ncbi:MAG: hypothetical protein KAR83_09180, partial [Thermodesulfovibrionales bacterium]|nr:hypothetical protein [Thermodesulfovibrionales bacterium]